MLFNDLWEKTSAYGVFSIDGHYFGLLSEKHWQELVLLAPRIDATVQDRQIALPSQHQRPLMQTWYLLYQALQKIHPNIRWRNRCSPLFAHHTNVFCGYIDRSLLRYCGVQSHCVRFWYGYQTSPQTYWLTQQRPLHKAIGPGLWDNTVAGLCKDKESPLEALTREMQEELALTLPLSSIQTYATTRCAYPIPDGIYHEVTSHTYYLHPRPHTLSMVTSEWLQQSYAPIEMILTYPLLHRARASLLLLQNYLQNITRKAKVFTQKT